MQEKELIEASKQGDDLAFKKLMDEYETKIFYFCLGKTKDEEAAKDLTQETFLKAFQHLTSFRSESSFYTWVYRIAFNETMNYLKKRERHKEEEFHEEHFSFHQEAKPAFEVEAVQEAIQMGLSLLSSKHRIVFELYDLQKKSHKEIAVELHIPEGTVRSRLHYARQKMRVFLKNYRDNQL